VTSRRASSASTHPCARSPSRKGSEDRGPRWSLAGASQEPGPRPAEFAIAGVEGARAYATHAELEESLLTQTLGFTYLGGSVTPVQDRDYFRSIYLRTRGVLFEIATLSPGFAVDEDASYRERPPGGDPAGLLVLHHGRGADEADLLSLADQLDPDRRLHVVAPRTRR
jgi:hypothetical protein